MSSESEDKMTGFRNFVIGCCFAASSLITPVGPAQAMPVPAPDLQIKTQESRPQGDVQTVQYHHRRHWRGGWDRGWRPHYRRGWGHRGWGGPRYGSGFSFYFGPGYGNYYGGDYYPRYPRYYYRDYAPRRYYRERHYYRDRYVRRGSGSHVNWCLSRYRSYNPATNRFLSYSGAYRVCYSPYR